MVYYTCHISPILTYIVTHIRRKTVITRIFNSHNSGTPKAYPTKFLQFIHHQAAHEHWKFCLKKYRLTAMPLWGLYIPKLCKICSCLGPTPMRKWG